DGLVVVNMSTSHKPEPFADYDAAYERFATLERRAAALPEGDRRLYYSPPPRPPLAGCRWRQGRLPLAEQLSGFLHVPAAPASDAELDGLRTEMRALLTSMGYSGDLAAQCAAWEERNRVPADEVTATLSELLSEAWDRTSERMAIPAP